MVYTEIRAMDIISKVVDSRVLRQNTCNLGKAFSYWGKAKISGFKYSCSLTCKSINLLIMIVYIKYKKIKLFI